MSSRVFRMANELSLGIEEESGKEVIAIRVFHNCLCMYFKKGSCKFYSKRGLDWGFTGAIYFITNKFSLVNIPQKLLEEYKNLIMWTSEYANANRIQKLWLQLEYKIKYTA